MNKTLKKLNLKNTNFKNLINKYHVDPSYYNEERGGYDNNHNEIIKGLYKMLDKWSIATESFIVYRGQPTHKFKANYKNIIPTSTNEEIAFGYTIHPFKILPMSKNRCCLNKIIVQPGIRYIDLKKELGNNESESEIILEGYQTLKFIKKYKKEITRHNGSKTNLVVQEWSYEPKKKGGVRKTRKNIRT